MKACALKVGALIVVLFVAACGSNGDVDIEAERAAVTEVIHNSIEWALDKDTVKLYESFVHDETLFFFQPRDEMKGYDALRETARTIWLDDRFKATHTEITDLHVTMSESGTVAWFRCLLDDEGEWDGQAVGWYDTRWTGVLEKRDGRWVIVQQHFSFKDEAE
jgi:ketosteroid isomerase-like protein